jgi:dolichol-phosphate mannosyltransferase
MCMISLVIPLHNEKENIGALVAAITDAANTFPLAEIVLVDDGSTDGTAGAVRALSHPQVRLIEQSPKSGQSTALWTGISAAKSDIIVTLDGDGQNPPSDIQYLWQAYTAAGAGKVMVAGQRAKRNDTAIRRISSRLANTIRQALLRDGIRDTGCSLKLFRRADYLMLPYFNHMHRYIPALLRQLGVTIVPVNVSHLPRAHGISKYGFFDRLWVGIGDLLGVFWLLRRFRPENFTTKEN